MKRVCSECNKDLDRNVNWTVLGSLIVIAIICTIVAVPVIGWINTIEDIDDMEHAFILQNNNCADNLILIKNNTATLYLTPIPSKLSKLNIPY